VEAAEELFVPVAVRNNVPGYEAEILARYDEPTWNNPVVRFIDAKGRDILPRKDRVWKTGPVLARMTSALDAAKHDVPIWLRTVAAETSSHEVETALFAMY
jgi:hypothetical protein